MAVISFSLLMKPPARRPLICLAISLVDPRHLLHRDMVGGGASRDLISQDIKDWSVMQCSSQRSRDGCQVISQLIHLLRGVHGRPFYTAGVAVITHRVELLEETDGF